MLNKLAAFIRQYDLFSPGDRVTCALSGGADSVAMTFGLYLLREKLDIQVAAAHFNHGLRGEESDGDEAFVRDFCARYEIPLTCGRGTVEPGQKGLEAAARDARYGFLGQLPGIIATAHTADDNAETVLLHLIRGTGLKGLGGIPPVKGRVVRPMLGITRQEVEAFCAEWSLPYVTDSSNHTDQFLRNRLRHHVMPLLRQENPRLGENVSAMALRLRQDEACLQAMTPDTDDAAQLTQLPPALQNRALEKLLKGFGVREPEAEHIALAKALARSSNPSASGQFPGGVTVSRCYGRLVRQTRTEEPEPVRLSCPGVTDLPQWGLRVTCTPARSLEAAQDSWVVAARGDIWVTSRRAGDGITLPGGTKSLKRLFIDRKIPACARSAIPVFRDDAGVLAVGGIGPNRSRLADSLPAVRIGLEHRPASAEEQKA